MANLLEMHHSSRVTMLNGLLSETIQACVQISAEQVGLIVSSRSRTLEVFSS